MSIEIKKKFKDLMLIILLCIVYVILQVLPLSIIDTPYVVFNGMFLAFQYALCLLMMRVNRKKGITVSVILMGLSALLLLRAVVFIHNTYALAGFINTVLYITTLIILGRYHQKRENESVTDMLTGILNRRGLYRNLRERIANDEKFSVIYLSLDNFKIINDNYGHTFGDALLKEVASRIQQQLGNNDSAARIGGAEFVAVFDGSIDAEKKANELLDHIKEKAVLTVGQARVNCHMTCYAGLSSYPNDSKDFEDIINYADIAMYEAIAKKSKTTLIFETQMADHLNRQIEVENLIKDGLVKDYFYLVYQPQYHLNGKKLRGFETLIRMKTPDGQFISPGEFIPIAEKGDLILEIDDYVLHRSMNEFCDIVKKNPDLTVSINVSAKNIGTAGFVDKLRSIIDETDFPPRNLEIEITEYCMVDSMDVTINNINGLREMGIQIALDDFGTGYTSLNYVAKLPINLLKVDKSLVDDIEKSEKNREFVHIIISMGHLMGFEVISEGVENEKQLEYLREDGCDFVQGYVWGKPLDYEIAKELSLK